MDALKILAVLVNGYGVTGVADVRIQITIVKLHPELVEMNST